MNQSDKSATIEKIATLWPKADWPKDVQVEFGRRLESLPIDSDQAHAALVNLRMSSKYQTVQPSEVLGALHAARSGGQAETGRAVSTQGMMWRNWLASNDMDRWYRPLASMFVQSQEPRATHWLDITDSLLDVSDNLRGSLARRFCEWVAQHARESGIAIRIDGGLSKFGAPFP